MRSYVYFIIYNITKWHLMGNRTLGCTIHGNDELLWRVTGSWTQVNVVGRQFSHHWASIQLPTQSPAYSLSSTCIPSDFNSVFPFKHKLTRLYRTSMIDTHRNQKDVGIAVVNKVHIQAWILLQLAPYIVTHNHPYISSCAVDISKSGLQLYTYVRMVMCDNVGC